MGEWNDFVNGIKVLMGQNDTGGSKRDKQAAITNDVKPGPDTGGGGLPNPLDALGGLWGDLTQGSASNPFDGQWPWSSGGGGSQPQQQAAPPSNVPVDPKAAAATVPQPQYQYPFSPLQAQVFLQHFLAPYLQQAQTPSMGDAAQKLQGMGYKINPQQTQDLQNVQDANAKALQSSFSSPMISFINMLTQTQGQDKAVNQALRDNYVTSLRTALQGANPLSSGGTLSTDQKTALIGDITKLLGGP